MTRTLNCLVDAGCVGRTDHPDGRPAGAGSVTDEGARVVLETRKRRNAWLARRLAELTATERETLAAASRIMLRLADA